MPYEEIAEVLELSVSAVKSLLFRARTTLRESLSGYMAE
jgi:RNA polymerase sigma-70 factor (ECF subfamily)